MTAPTYDVAIGSVVDETPLDRSFSLVPPAGAEAAFRFVPGQFVTVSDPHDPVRPPRKRAYSISSSPLDDGNGRGGRLEVTVRDSGDFGSRFFRLPVGAVLHAIPPRGRFTLDSAAPADDLVLAAGGSGVSPYRGFVRYLRATGRDRPVTLFVSARVPEQLVFDAEFRRHATEVPWFRYAPTVTRLEPGASWNGLRGRLDASRMGGFVREPATTTLFACGPNEFVDAMLAVAATLGIPPERIHREKWG